MCTGKWIEFGADARHKLSMRNLLPCVVWHTLNFYECVLLLCVYVYVSARCMRMCVCVHVHVCVVCTSTYIQPR